MKLSNLDLARSTIAFLSIFFCTSCFAADTAAPLNTAPGNLIQTIVSLVVVVGLLIVLSVAFKKFGLNRIQAAFPVKVIGAISLGNNQRIMLIEAGDEWIVLGVTPQHISTITSMPRQVNSNMDDSTSGKPPFSTWMQSTLEKYRANKT